jgi:hypothetical protein
MTCLPLVFTATCLVQSYYVLFMSMFCMILGMVASLSCQGHAIQPSVVVYLCNGLDSMCAPSHTTRCRMSSTVALERTGMFVPEFLCITSACDGVLLSAHCQ